MAEVDAVNAAMEDGFRVFKGIECDILADGTLDLPLDLLGELDVVVASVHSHQRQDRETLTARVVRALESGVVDILAHPTGRILGARDPSAVDMERVMDAALANNVALEMNAYPDRLDMNDELALRAKERGIPISLNTDAHRPEHLSMLRYGIAQARRAWLEPENVINTWPLERLAAWLQLRER
jgi:DNA polymerase (family 10)